MEDFIMATKIKTIALIAILSVLQVNAQETRMFLPIFSDADTTVRCYIAEFNLHRYSFSLKIVKDPDLARTYKVVKYCNYWDCFINDFHSFFVSFTVSEDNSKLWGNAIDELNGDTIPILIMDLNLSIGDTFDDIHNCCSFQHQFTVVDIYEFDGRKHIEFDFRVVTGHPLIFIEGVGPTFYPTTHPATIFRAKDIGGSMEYCVFSLLTNSSLYWRESCDCSYHFRYTSVESNIIDSIIRLYPQPVNTELNLQVPEGIDMQDAQIRIYDTNGNLHLHTSFAKSGRKLNVGNLMPGIFLLRIIGSNINETVKFIKT